MELLLNDQSLGRRQRDVNDFPAMGLHWDVTFREDLNELKAVGYSSGNQ
ncbi:DUF4982 domain-containing protein, partial [Candidatus Neomarinimicrobiota bacterium]